MDFNYSKLRGRIREICDTQDKFSELMGISKATISAKLNNKSEFTQPEILRAAKILKIEPEELSGYFFTQKVQKTKPQEAFSYTVSGVND